MLAALFPGTPGLEAQSVGPASQSLSSSGSSLLAPSTSSARALDDFQRTVQRSGLIFEGTVAAVQCEFGKGKLPQTYRIRFQVRQGVRGIRTGSSLVIREWAGLRVPGRGPRYRVGERAMLFLYSPSRTGLTSTVGGSKGRLAVVADRRGGDQVALPAEWLASVGLPPAGVLRTAGWKAPSDFSVAKASPWQSAHVPLAWLIQRVAEAGAATSGGR